MSTGNNQSERNSGNAGVSTSNTPPTTFMQRISWLGGKVLDIAERVGEGVVSFLGLDDSHFQDVLDNMTEEEIAAAVEVNNQRNDEYRRAGLLPPQSELPLDMTVEDVSVELIGNPPGLYSAVDASEEACDIENPRPVVSMNRADTGVELVNNSSSIGFNKPKVPPTGSTTLTSTSPSPNATAASSDSTPSAPAIVSLEEQHKLLAGTDNTEHSAV
mmetsp:Transcript_124432/g.244051  ORF Transcript_124432/g.244051 Transcript_124432/m.244051 type:complete len:216 (+) Transcript_124432:112-759(+)|eukprot:CAMPEP_0170363246 /NCGR_PEP_ID=MMETSP0117_2-20130122/4757_1 /TAXON_ID=400756 /ORGANISM="Durinskia baltica, Strain CSIRO CS-38" /LENGTH=215 /DNA_ID=CAMNT_0010617705 /DNA_START=94 /DNA_END=741 /DNA_ORIENTATION=+